MHIFQSTSEKSYACKDIVEINIKDITYEGVEWIYLHKDRNQSVAVENCHLFKLPLSEQFGVMLG
jgi:hypothetical protein